MSTWSELNLSPEILKAIEQDFKFTSLLPVQKHCIPKMIHENKDLAAQAITGSGKTMAFLVPILQKIINEGDEYLKPAVPEGEEGERSLIPKIYSLIITPTRELAIQIRNVLEKLSKYIENFNFLCLSSSNLKTKEELEQINKNLATIIISTPGRLADLIEQSGDINNSILKKSLKKLEYLIIDEADRVLSDNFREQMDIILPSLAKQRRTSLFSATLDKEKEVLIKMLNRAGLRNPVKVVVKESFQLNAEDKKESSNEIVQENTPTLLNSFYLPVTDVSRKFDLLITFLAEHKKEKCLVFFTTCAQVDYFSRAIKSVCGQYCRVFETHGRTKKNKRESVFEEFSNFTGASILVCTDVMARGVDFPNVNWVIQFDIPQNAENFVHRCGRTARAGHNGNSIVFLMKNELDYINFLQINQKVKQLQKLDLPEKILNTGSATLARLCKTDRRMIELGTRAFVSFVQAYSKHEQNVIIKTKDLNFGRLANTYILFQIPRMPELKNRKTDDFQSRFGDKLLEDIPYKDKSIRIDREKRQEIRKAEFIQKKQALSKEFGERYKKLGRNFHGKLGQKPFLYKESKDPKVQKEKEAKKAAKKAEYDAEAEMDDTETAPKGKIYMPKSASQWTEKKDKEELRKKRKAERAARKEYKKQKMLEATQA